MGIAGARTSLITAMTLLCLSHPVSAQAPGWLAHYIYYEPDKVDRNAASPATLVHHAVEVTFDKKRPTSTRHQVAWFINSSRGREKAALAAHVSPHRKAKDIAGWLWDGERILRCEEEWILEVASDPASSVYTQDRRLFASFPFARPGSLLGWEYTIDDQDESRLTQVVSFPVDCHTQRVQVTVRIPDGWELQYGMTRPEEWEVSRDGDRWILEGGPWGPIEPEPAAPPATEDARAVWLVAQEPGSPESHADWTSVSRHLLEVFREPSEAGPRVKTAVRHLTEEFAEAEQQIRALCDFVQKDVRYVGIEIGKGRWIPRLCDFSFDNRYADCKDKTALLRAMLTEIGVPSVPVLVNTRFAPLPDVTTPYQFNHCILAIRADTVPASLAREARLGDWILFDPTDEVTPLGALPPYLADNTVLIGGDPDPFRPVGVGRWTLRSREFVAVARITETGDFAARVQIRETGLYGRQRRSLTEDASADELSRIYRELFRSSVSDPRISDLRVESSGDTCRAFLELRGTKVITAAGDVRLFDPSLFPPPLDVAGVGSQRTRPTWLGPPQLTQARVQWQVPHGWHPVTSGTLGSGDIPGTRFSRSMSAGPEAVTCQWTYQQEGARYPADQSRAVDAFLSDFRSAWEVPLLIRAEAAR